MTGTREVYGVVEDPRYPRPSLVKAGYVVHEDKECIAMRLFLWPESGKCIIPPPSTQTDKFVPLELKPAGPWETLRSAAHRTGYAYNTFKKWRYLGILPFPVYEDRLYPGQRPKITVRVADVDAWKQKTPLVAGRSRV